MKALPKGPAPKAEKKTPESEPEKAAFYAHFLEKCAAAGVTQPAAVAAVAEAMLKAADFWEGLGKVVGGVGGVLPVTAVLGSVVAPAAAGMGVGGLTAAGANQADREDKEVLRTTAAANAYRRQADAARLHARIRKLVASDPKTYVPLA